MPTPTSTASATPAKTETPTETPTETVSAGASGQRVAFRPAAADVAWWASGDTRAKHLGDAYLYAGAHGDLALISVIQFRVQGVPQGAEILRAEVLLTGLPDGRYNPAQGGEWSADAFALQSAKDLPAMGFAGLEGTKSKARLSPTLSVGDLAAGRRNTLSFDEAGRDWLAQQVISGTATIAIRITGPSLEAPNLFVWSSGTGADAADIGPVLTLTIANPQASPLSTAAQRGATATPTPANAQTVAARALTATARPTGTPTPLAIDARTATPMRSLLVASSTPTPANAATAAARVSRATSVAVTTGTFTPSPPMVTPTPNQP